MRDVVINLAWGALAAVLLWRPAVWGVGWLVRRLEGWLKGREPEGLPCPACGYDCRAFDRRQKSHRCPECGVELRWGQLK